MARVPFENLLTPPQRRALGELRCGPLYRFSGDRFARQGSEKVVRVQPLRGLMDMGLAVFDSKAGAMIATAKAMEGR